MIKKLFWLLLLVNLVFFALIQWGAAWMDDSQNMQPQAPFNAEKIKLQTVLSMVPAHVPPPVVAQPAVTATSGAICLEWGEFSGGDFFRANAALSELNLGDKLAQKQTEHAGGYWVYIPPLKNRAEVDKKIGQLKVRGVQEHFVIKESGKWQNAISLGIFKTEEAAQKFLGTLISRGVKSARVGERMSKLTFTVFQIKNLDTTMSDKIGALQNQFPGSDLKAVPCSE